MEGVVTAARSRRPRNVTLTTHVPNDVAREIQRLAGERGISVSACVAALLSEALRAPMDHQHASLSEATIERVLNTRLERIDTHAYKAARESYRSRWLTVALLELLGEHLPAKPDDAAIERASQLNTESYRDWRKKKRAAGEAEDGWQAPS
jgi:hypothetical protein